MRNLIVACIVFVVFLLGCKVESNKKAAGTMGKDESNKLIEAGKEITSSTFLALSTELQRAIKIGGVEHAMVYCNENALAITDSLSKLYNVDIKRTSLKWRNPENEPNTQEVKMLTSFQEKHNKSEMMLPQLINEKSSNIFYSPIMLQDMCLKCHGSRAEITQYDLIKSLYPNDMAYGYRRGELRGMWSVTFKNKI